MGTRECAMCGAPPQRLGFVMLLGAPHAIGRSGECNNHIGYTGSGDRTIGLRLQQSRRVRNLSKQPCSFFGDMTRRQIVWMLNSIWRNRNTSRQKHISTSTTCLMHSFQPHLISNNQPVLCGSAKLWGDARYLRLQTKLGSTSDPQGESGYSAQSSKRKGRPRRSDASANSSSENGVAESNNGLVNGVQPSQSNMLGRRRRGRPSKADKYMESRVDHDSLGSNSSVGEIDSRVLTGKRRGRPRKGEVKSISSYAEVGQNGSESKLADPRRKENVSSDEIGSGAVDISSKSYDQDEGLSEVSSFSEDASRMAHQSSAVQPFRIKTDYLPIDELDFLNNAPNPSRRRFPDPEYYDENDEPETNEFSNRAMSLLLSRKPVNEEEDESDSWKEEEEEEEEEEEVDDDDDEGDDDDSEEFEEVTSPLLDLGLEEDDGFAEPISIPEEDSDVDTVVEALSESEDYDFDDKLLSRTQLVRKPFGTSPPLPAGSGSPWRAFHVGYKKGTSGASSTTDNEDARDRERMKNFDLVDKDGSFLDAARMSEGKDDAVRLYSKEGILVPEATLPVVRRVAAKEESLDVDDFGEAEIVKEENDGDESPSSKSLPLKPLLKLEIDEVEVEPKDENAIGLEFDEFGPDNEPFVIPSLDDYHEADDSDDDALTGNDYLFRPKEGTCQYAPTNDDEYISIVPADPHYEPQLKRQSKRKNSKENWILLDDDEPHEQIRQVNRITPSSVESDPNISPSAAVKQLLHNVFPQSFPVIYKASMARKQVREHVARQLYEDSINISPVDMYKWAHHHGSMPSAMTSQYEVWNKHQSIDGVGELEEFEELRALQDKYRDRSREKEKEKLKMAEMDRKSRLVRQMNTLGGGLARGERMGEDYDDDDDDDDDEAKNTPSIIPKTIVEEEEEEEEEADVEQETGQEEHEAEQEEIQKVQQEEQEREERLVALMRKQRVRKSNKGRKRRRDALDPGSAALEIAFTFPCTYKFRVVGHDTNHVNMVPNLRKELEEVLRRSIPPDAFKRDARSRNTVVISVDVANAREVSDIYEAIRGHPQVKFSFG